MKAYKIPIVNNCQTEGCPKMARHEVHQQVSPDREYERGMEMIPNPSLGRYCEQCADALIEKLNAEWFLDHASDQGCQHQYTLTHAGGAGFECLECGHVASDHEIDVALNSRAELLERGRRLAQWAQEAHVVLDYVHNMSEGNLQTDWKISEKSRRLTEQWETQDE